MNIFVSNNDFEVADCFFATSKYRPFIGISIGSTPPPLQKAVEILSWVLRSNSELIPILFADDIAHINYRGLGYSSGKVLHQVESAKEKQLTLWNDALIHLTLEEKSRFRLISWNEIVTDTFLAQQSIVRRAFAEEGRLYVAILWLVEQFIRSAGHTVSTKRCLGMVEYVIQELPLLLFGMELDNVHYQMMLYPTYYTSEMLSFIAEIRRKPYFSDIIADLCDVNSLEYNKIIQMIVGERGAIKPNSNIINSPVISEELSSKSKSDAELIYAS